jgi:AraC-like DNA-binding protein
MLTEALQGIRADRAVKRGEFARPLEGPAWAPDAACPHVGPALPAWQSNGGPTRAHPARSLPFSFECSIDVPGEVTRITLVGVFALYAEHEHEAEGTLGASIHLMRGEEAVHRQDLVNGRHYGDPECEDPPETLPGDGAEIETLATTRIDGRTVRVDALSFDVPPGLKMDRLRFKDLGSPASFLVFDVWMEYAQRTGCPFGGRSGGVALSELASVVRLGDRVLFGKAVEQLENAIHDAEDLDEARGQALTFLAVVTAASLEMGGGREMHRVQLEAARQLDRMEDAGRVTRCILTFIEKAAGGMLRPKESPSGHLVDRALGLIERNYARNLTDAAVAEQLGLSTSHFRHLFRQATGQPFHKYLTALRLEKARKLLVEQHLPVSKVAQAVGFSGLSHFSRAFSQRFAVSPTHMRKAGD